MADPSITPVRWSGTELVLIDQTRLPHETVLVPCHTPKDVARAIKSMQVRGAPAIGVERVRPRAEERAIEAFRVTISDCR